MCTVATNEFNQRTLNTNDVRARIQQKNLLCGVVECSRDTNEHVRNDTAIETIRMSIFLGEINCSTSEVLIVDVSANKRSTLA